MDNTDTYTNTEEITEMMDNLEQGDLLKLVVNTTRVIDIPILEWVPGKDGKRRYVIGNFDSYLTDQNPSAEPHPAMWYWDERLQEFISECHTFRFPEGREVIVEQQGALIHAALYEKDILEGYYGAHFVCN